MGAALGSLLLPGPAATLCFGPLLTAASTACSNRSHAPGSVSMFSGFGFLGGFFAMTDSIPEKSPYPDPPEDRMNEFYIAYGKVIDEWAFIEFVLAHIFGAITLIDNRMSEALFYSGRSFQTRRDLLAAAIEHSPAKGAADDILEFAKACLKKANQYSTFRNALAHRLILWNHITDRGELREGDDIENLDSKKLYLIEDLVTAQKNYHSFRMLMLKVIKPETYQPELSPEEGRELILALPNEAQSPPTTPTP